MRIHHWLLAMACFCLSQTVLAKSYIDVEKAAARSESIKEKKFYQDLVDIHAALAKVSGLKLRLLVSDNEDINAFATEAKGEKLVVLNMGLIEALQDDRDAVVAVLAHEYAHHGKEHIGKTKSTGTVFGVLGAIAGAVIDFKLGTSRVGSTLGKTGAEIATSSFSRDQEREADALGMQWMVEAGYNPQGAVRMQQKLMELAGSDDKFSLFRSHPPSKDRASDLEALIAKNTAAKPLLSLPLVALQLPPDDDEDDDGTATASVPTTSQRQGLVRSLPPVRPASLAPIDGFSLERYAGYVNALASTDEAALPSVHARFGLTEASGQKLTDAWVERMRADPGLAATYGAAYLDAAVGPFAKWGQDTARAQRDGGQLSGEPPIPQADWIRFSQLQSRLYAEHKDYKVAAAKFAEATAASNMRPYDFHIASMWWNQLARQKADRGDMSLLTKLTSRD